MFRSLYTAVACGVLGHEAAWPSGHPHVRTLGAGPVRCHLCDCSTGPFSVSSAISQPPLGRRGGFGASPGAIGASGASLTLALPQRGMHPSAAGASPLVGGDLKNFAADRTNLADVGGP